MRTLMVVFVALVLLSSPTFAQEQSAQGAGAEVTKVQDGSAAAKAGLKPGDRILSIGGEKILDVAHLRSVIGRHIAGERIKLVFKRGETEKEVEATLGVPVAPKKPVVRPKKPTPKKPMPKKPVSER